MRDNFGFGYATPKEENKQIKVENQSFGGNHVSSNVYYGYQPLTYEHKKEETYERMDIQIVNHSGIAFNNSNLDDRLCAINRKRPFEDDALPPTIFKKRRENAFSELSPSNKCLNLRQPTHNVPDIPRTLMGHYI